jgi:exodeoxyribonuclease V gamma subunit
MRNRRTETGLMAAPALIHLHRSNRTEVLVEELATILKRDPLSPMEQEWVVVQGPGMQRWLSIELSKRLGVWANARFPFPRHLIDTAMRGVLDYREAAESALQPGPLLWAVAQELSGLQKRSEFAEIRNYLRGSGKGRGSGDKEERERKLFQLADRVAHVFDRYTIYRPQLLSEWEAGEGKGWQPSLWRALTENYDPHHPGAMLSRFLGEVGRDTGPISGIPRRVCLFGISSLPPVYMRVLSALAARVELHLFVLSPSRQYWADLRRRGRNAELLDEGNSLLASLGRLSGDFQQVLEDNAEYQESERDLYRLPEGESMLATLQADILDLRSRRLRRPDEVEESKPLPLPIAEADQSISFHSCHSPMREVEVLHDQITGFLEADKSLEARDIVVMTPDIEIYAPLIDAVFASDKRDRPRIPYRIADRSDRSSYPVLQAFSQILETLGGRMTATDVLDLLALDVVSSRFGLFEEDLVRVRDWVRESGVRWGVDAEHRDSVNQPEIEENTWRFGLDRLLLGYAMEGEGRDLYGGVLPFDAMEGNDTQVLGRFLDFASALFRFRELFARPTSLENWSAELSGLLETLVHANESNLVEHRLVRDTIEGLLSDAQRVDFDQALSFKTVSDLLQQSWQESEAARGFLSGGVTFCQLMPMRSIPFRVVCVLGMSDGAFPRSVHPLGFDRMAAEPLTGDRTPRDDDRYLFLEAILAARDTLLISYVGRSIHNNADIPPSVLVGELMDVLGESFTSSLQSRLLWKEPRHTSLQLLPGLRQGSGEPGARPGAAAVLSLGAADLGSRPRPGSNHGRAGSLLHQPHRVSTPAAPGPLHS